jgi:hypothetical protein
MAGAKARALTMSAGKDEMVKTELQKEPILRWSNPTAGSVHGEVFLWTVGNRPVAIASIYRWYHPFRDASVELAAVRDTPMEARENDVVYWQTSSSNVVFQPIPDAARPANGRAGRLNQMRSLARRFSAELTDERGGTRVDRELRLLNQPAHRYEAGDRPDDVDGGLFAFVEGTDPEAWLILETVKNDAGSSWCFALARMNVDAIQVLLDNKVVHTWPKDLDAWRDRTLGYRISSFNPAAVHLEEPKSPAGDSQRSPSR